MADVDYDGMQHAMAYLKTSRGVRPVRMKVPEPATTANILAAYEVALKRNPGIKLVLLTHVSNRNGLVLPVREIADMARRYEADVILDSAQAVGLLSVDVAALGIDFMGFSLHKWVAARSAPAESTFANHGLPISTLGSATTSGQTAMFAPEHPLA